MHRILSVSLILAIATQAGAQAPIDSVRRLNAAGEWQAALTLARPALAASSDTATRCALRASMLLSYDRLGRLDNGADALSQFDRECRRTALATDGSLADLRRDLTLPQIPATGLDFSGIPLLAGGRHPHRRPRAV